MILFDGKKEAENLDVLISNAAITSQSKTLCIIQIGDNAASEKYIEIKQNLCNKMGIPCVVRKFEPENNDLLTDEVSKIAQDPNISSIIIQLPLPSNNYYSLLDLIPLEKDIDVLSNAAKETFNRGKSTFNSPVIRAVEHFIYSDLVNYDTLKNVGIIGYGDLVGKPLYVHLSRKFENVQVIQNYNQGDFLDYDFIILSTDVPNLVKGQDIKNKSNVIDFGSSVVNGKTVGNLDLSSNLDHLGVVSKSPGGMGPLVVRYLLLNHLGH